MNELKKKKTNRVISKIESNRDEEFSKQNFESLLEKANVPKDIEYKWLEHYKAIF